MLDNVFSSVRRGVQQARVRGEEAYQTTRLRLEIFNLNREQDLLFGRLGRAYHGGADVAVLAQIQTELRRVEDEIRGREALIAELSHPAAPAPATPVTPTTLVIGPGHLTPPGPVVPTAPDPLGTRAAAMSADPTRSVPGGEVEPSDPAQGVEPADSPDVQRKVEEGNERTDPPSTLDRPGQPQEDRQRDPIRQAELREGQMATEHPDPLDK